MTKLEVQICTYGERMRYIRPLPKVEGVAYLISCQGNPAPIPTHLVRDDIKVIFNTTAALSNNRNYALRHSGAPIVLIADDDEIFLHSGLEAIIEKMEAHPEVDVATFQSVHPQKRVYPPCEHNLWKKYRFYNPISIEIALRMDSIRRHSLSFNPLFGLGAPYLQAAEENVLLLCAERQKLVGRFFPIEIAEHSKPTTAEHSPSSAGYLRAQGAYIALRYGLTAMPRMALMAMRTKGNTVRHMLYILQGARYAWANKKLFLRGKIGK